MQNKLVIDIGSKYLKIGMFGIMPNLSQPVLLDLIIRDIDKKNDNILGRIIAREYYKLCVNYEISEVIILPKRSELLHYPMTVEYLNDKEKMKRALIRQINDTLPQGDFISDWKVEDDNPDEDYYKVTSSSITLEQFKFISELMKTLNVRDYKITSPTVNLPELAPSDGRAYAILHVGHKNVGVSIVINGICQFYKIVKTYNAFKTADIVMQNESLTQDELYHTTNNANCFDLESYMAESEIKAMLSDEVFKACSEFTELNGKNVVGLLVVGGMANLDIENLYSDLDIPITRIYPKLPLANDKKIPYTVRNYVYELACALIPVEEGVNFTAPKDKSLGQYVKALTSFFSRYQVAFYIFIILLVAKLGATYAINYYLQDVVASQQVTVTNYQTEVGSLDTTVKSLEAEYSELLDDKDLAIVNYGETLSRLSSIIPQGTFITEIRDVTAEYLPTQTDALTQQQPEVTQTGAVVPLEGEIPALPNSTVTKNGLTASEDMLVALEIKGYTNVRYKAFDYALLLDELDTDGDGVTNSDAVVTSVETDEQLFKYTIHLIINK